MSRKADELDRHIGLRLKLRRILLNMSQDELASGIGVTFQQLQKYEKASNRISASRLYEIAKLLKVEVAYFYDGYEEDSKIMIAEKNQTLNDYMASLPKKKNYTQEEIVSRVLNMPPGKSKENIIEDLKRKLDEQV